MVDPLPQVLQRRSQEAGRVSTPLPVTSTQSPVSSLEINGLKSVRVLLLRLQRSVVAYWVLVTKYRVLTFMDRIVFESVRKIFRHRPSLFNWMGRERRGETVALKDVSFAAGRAEVLALLGPNGSGKTTALKLISTMLLPEAGSVRVGGFDGRRDAGEVRRQVGIAVAAERSFYPRLSARENLYFFATLDEVSRRERAPRIQEVLHDTGLEGQADTLVMKFSSGMYQR